MVSEELVICGMVGAMRKLSQEGKQMLETLKAWSWKALLDHFHHILLVKTGQGHTLHLTKGY